MKINPGSPAFPSSAYECNGISIRAYFAAKAMQGLLASPVEYPEGEPIEDYWKRIAESSVAYADALIAELSKETSK